ncbi:MAG: adenylate kinase [Chloroflexota bacterium]|nr:adenylate kinase [Chloroflexota bacterium]
MYVILLGPPGAGKGTQAKMLAEVTGLAYVSSGDLFRRRQLEGAPLGLKAKEYMERGALVPDEVTIAMVLEQLESGSATGYLLDGFPRNMAQARALDEALAKKGQAVDRVLSLTVAAEELVVRLSGRLVCRQCQAPYHLEASPPRVKGRCDRCGGELYQRKDDSPEVVRQRIRVYERETEPLIQYYRVKGVLAAVDGAGSIQEVNHRLEVALAAGKGFSKAAG